MKSILFISAIAASMVACERPTGILEREVICLLDMTDLEFTPLPFEKIKPFITTDDLNNGVRFSARLIEDNDFGQRFSAGIKPMGTEEQTMEERYAQKSRFLKDAQISYDSIKARHYGKPNSVIYRVIACELNALSRSTASEKVLIVHSDLFENSDLLQMYSDDVVQRLTDNPKLLIDEFIKVLPIQRLENTIVYFLFQPKDFETNQKYRAILYVYEQIITEAGGVVKTGF